ncbi:MAG: UDP-4-amino-4,6-dideoxy-N-acetyl-beta-L-altrosamine N-acetyltransferase [Thiotrichales bacterium]|nr:UDP-4-amino-4,6-dideoxy-N-acetyl-beta-L-altrosamine N-acetyltransferase [Thiotrichales bacterium]
MNLITPHFGEVTLINFTELSKEDALSVLKMRNHPEICKWMYHPEAISETEHFRFIESLKKDTTKHYFVVKKVDAFIGSINFTKVDDMKKTADFGLYANPFFTLTGAGQILEEAATNYASHTLNLNVLNLEVFAKNQRAIAFYQKNGFVQLGIKTINHQSVWFMQKVIKEN